MAAAPGMEHGSFPEPGPAASPLFISPHLDDGVFACGRLLASWPGATVATVFAGRPPPGQPLTDWDRAAGFRAGDDVIGRRREEDRRALALLDARPRWLDLRDSQYGGSDEVAVAARLAALLEDCRPDMVFIPLGLFHSDHRLAHAAALGLLEDFRQTAWCVYEDALYRRLAGERRAALARLAPWRPRPVWFPEAPAAAARKAAAVACYRSQLRALATPGRPGLADLAGEEAYWCLRPRPPLLP